MSKQKELPQVLVLKRSYTQRFPNGQQVALYHSEALNQFITVPLDGSQFTNTTESIVEQLNLISNSNETQTLLFNDCSELNINKECADIILSFIESNEELKEHLLISDKSFLEVLEHAVQVLDNTLNKSELMDKLEQEQESLN